MPLLSTNGQEARMTYYLQPPKGFTDEERLVWIAAQKQLKAQGTWTGKSDAPLLEAYVKNAVLARRARLRLGDRIEVGPVMKIAAEAEAAAHKFASALLLTPEARKRHGVKSVEGGAENELQALVA
jgi:phage terminase small subunit